MELIILSVSWGKVMCQRNHVTNEDCGPYDETSKARPNAYLSVGTFPQVPALQNSLRKIVL